MKQIDKNDWKAINRYIERNTKTGECRLAGTTEIIPNLRYDNDNGLKNYAVKSFREKRSTNITTDTTTDIYTPVRDVEIMLGEDLVVWDGKEYWKPIPYNDYYQVSTWGNVRTSRGNYLSPWDNGKGYQEVRLSKKGYKPKSYSISRLVAEAFLPNPENLSDVDHIETKEKANNRVDNLQWLSHEDNIRKDLCKPLIMLDKDTEDVVLEFNSGTDAAEYIKGLGKGKTIHSAQVNISHCALGKKKTAYGFKWKYKD